MKTVVLFFMAAVCSAVIFGGCAGMKTERGFKDNIFYSSRQPEINIKMDTDFKYLGGRNQGLYQKFTDSVNYGTLHHMDVHTFMDVKQDNRVQRIVMIFIQNMYEGYFPQQSLFPWMKHRLISGNTDIHGDSYQYAVEAFDSKYCFTNQGTALKDDDYILPDFFLVKALGKIEKDTIIQILYFEDIDFVSHKHKFADWAIEENLSGEQRSLLKEFIKRSEQDIKILSDN